MISGVKYHTERATHRPPAQVARRGAGGGGFAFLGAGAGGGGRETCLGGSF